VPFRDRRESAEQSTRQIGETVLFQANGAFVRRSKIGKSNISRQSHVALHFRSLTPGNAGMREFAAHLFFALAFFALQRNLAL
jgi:hypothetical protein